jgi:hypothetical protein
MFLYSTEIYSRWIEYLAGKRPIDRRVEAFEGRLFRRQVDEGERGRACPYGALLTEIDAQSLDAAVTDIGFGAVQKLVPMFTSRVQKGADPVAAFIVEEVRRDSSGAMAAYARPWARHQSLMLMQQPWRHAALSRSIQWLTASLQGRVAETATGNAAPIKRPNSSSKLPPPLRPAACERGSAR